METLMDLVVVVMGMRIAVMVVVMESVVAMVVVAIECGGGIGGDGNGGGYESEIVYNVWCDANDKSDDGGGDTVVNGGNGVCGVGGK